MEYLDGITKAIAFIEANLDSNLTPELVAANVGFSTYHFHRIFKATTGETIAEHIRKRRLGQAAAQLVASKTPIVEIAHDACFETQESFTRAFKKMFGDTPNNFRRNPRSSSMVVNRAFKPEQLVHLRSGVTMEPKFVERGEELAIGMAGSFQAEPFKDISQLWQRFVAREDEITNRIPGYAIGICMESHPDVELKEGDSIIYAAALPVKDIDPKSIPEGMVACRVPASKYAVFTHKGALANLPHTVSYIWGTWVPRNAELVKKHAPDLEIYDKRFNEETLDGEFDIYLPIN